MRYLPACPGWPLGAAARGRCPETATRPRLGRAGSSMAEPAGPQAPHAAFYGPVARGNPVEDSFEAELRRVLSSLRRLRGAREAQPPQHDLHRHRANTLFNIWIKCKPRLPEWYYNERLVKVGDALAQIKTEIYQNLQMWNLVWQ